MQDLFKTIVVPIDFSLNTEVAICKALEIADGSGTTFHLLHIRQHLPDINLRRREEALRHDDAEKKLQQWQESIEDYLPAATVIRWVVCGSSVQQAIIDKAIEVNADLIVIGKKTNHSWFPFLNTVFPSHVAKAANCAVLTVKPGSLHKKIKNVVVPISEDMPLQKMKAIVALCRKNRIRIFLVTFSTKAHVPENEAASSLLKVFQWLKNSVPCQVEYAVLHGQNKVKSILRFAELNNADILLLYSETETKIGWPDKHISDVLPPASKVQVLTVGTAMA